MVFTDLAMPGMTGWQVARAVKDRAPEVPVVMMSGFGVEVAPEDLPTHGVDLVLAKPLQIQDILRALASVRPRKRPAMTSPIITEAVRTLVDRRDLTRIEAAAAMEAIMSGAATNAQIAAFLTALRMKGETVEELIGFAQVMRQKVVQVRARGADAALRPARTARC